MGLHGGIIFQTSLLDYIHVPHHHCSLLLQVENGTRHTFLADFGLAKFVSQTHVFSTRTMKAGTPGFQAPEQLKQHTLSVSCDMYAFGGVVIELFGENPVWPLGLSHFQIMYKVSIEQVMPSTSHLDGAIQAICSQCLTADSIVRATALQILQMLLSLILKVQD